MNEIKMTKKFHTINLDTPEARFVYLRLIRGALPKNIENAKYYMIMKSIKNDINLNIYSYVSLRIWKFNNLRCVIPEIHLLI